MMDLGEPRRIYTVEPIEDPVPRERPAHPDKAPAEPPPLPERAPAE
jgi:hypothetical protein